MYSKKFSKIFIILIFFSIIVLFIYYKFIKNNKVNLVTKESEDVIYNSNLIKNVEYSTKDKDGNEYFIKAQEGEIDFANPNIIFLKKVNALIKLTDSEKVTVTSDFGKYNSKDYDTIFSKNVIINYLDNKITGGYLDFSLKRNSMIISKNINYINPENILVGDVIEIDIKTKDTKIFMYEDDKKINIKNKN